METYNLATSQNVTLEYRIASVGDRILAYIIDLLIMASAILSVVLIISQVFGNFSPWFILTFIPMVFYHFLFEVLFNGQSPGKMIFHIRVVKTDGSQLTLGSCFIRWIFRFLDVLISGGALAVAFIVVNGKGQRLGDVTADTTVLKLSKKGELNNTSYVDLEDDYKPKFHEVEALTDKDIQTIKEVLKTSLDRDFDDVAISLVKQTRKVIAEKTGIESELGNRDFLITIVKDYNAINLTTT